MNYIVQMPKFNGQVKEQARQRVKRTKTYINGHRPYHSNATYNFWWNCHQTSSSYDHLKDDNLQRCVICSCLASQPKEIPYWCEECFELLYEHVSKEPELVKPKCTVCKGIATFPKNSPHWCSPCFDKMYYILVTKSPECLSCCTAIASEPASNPTWCEVCFAKKTEALKKIICKPGCSTS